MRNTEKFGLVSIPISIIFCLAFTIHVTLADNYLPTEKILLSCGGPPVTTDTDGRKWTTDVGSKYLSASGNSKISIAATQDPSVPEVPYMNARVFNSNFTYSIPVVAGRKFVRLYFYPASYAGLNPSDGVFSVTVGPYTLLNNFSAAQTAEAINFAFLVKEYSINVDGATLDISFAPSTKVPKAYAFVNGIEIVSMPDIYNSSYTPTGDVLMIVGQSSPFTIDNTTALENVYRLNVGGNDISPSQDTGLYRSWSDDFAYLYGAALGVSYSADQSMKIQYPPGMPSYVAPQDVYATARSMGPNPQININYNLTWIFSVDSGFSYLVRLHFCEIQSNITLVNQRLFDIFLYNQTAETGADVVAWARNENPAGNGDGVPVYRDYLVLVPSGSPQQDLWLALHPNQSLLPNYYDAILNGIEIFKVNETNGNLAGPNPIPAPKQDVIDPTRARTSSGDRKTKNHKAIIIGGVSGGIFLALVIGFFLFAASRHRHGKDSSASEGPSGWLPLSLYGNSHSAGSAKTNTTGSYASSLPSNLCRHFSFAEIKAATKNFDEAQILGVGGPTLDNTHVSTVVKGSFGYLDPEYFRRQQLTEKSDVYSFGVVLFEILCARPALNPTLAKEQVSLAEWAAHCHKKGILDQILDPYLKGKIAPECFKKFAETAMKCVADQSIERPSMGDVLWNLEFALQLQESAEESGEGSIGGMGIEEEPFVPYKGKKDPDALPGFDSNVTDSRSSGMSMSIGGRSLASEDSDGLTPSAVFSQIMNPKGR
ncbi:receptor-like protein kinase FERONIA [Fagus crenata]